MQNSDLHFGPVFFRYQNPDQGKAYISQTIHFPFWLEGGRQWGLGMGIKERFIALPVVIQDGSTQESILEQLDKGESLQVFTDEEPGQWNLSMFYLRIDYRSDEKFLINKTFGLRICGGQELYAFSAGISKTSTMNPAKDSIYTFAYESDHPMDTVFRSWKYRGDVNPSLEILKKEAVE